MRVSRLARSRRSFHFRAAVRADAMREISNTSENVGKPGLGIDLVEAAGRDHRQHDGDTIGAGRLPPKVQLRLPNAVPLNASSAQLLVKQILPSSMKRAKSSQRLTM